MTRRRHLTLIEGGLSGRQRRDEARARVTLYGYALRSVRAEPKPARHPRPVPPPTRPAA